jgi:hypothetical protein
MWFMRGARRFHARVREQRKRHKKKARRTPTRLPTKRMATACWAFIVAKRPVREAAPMLDFCSLHDANSNFCSQLINKALWTGWGYSIGLGSRPARRANAIRKAAAFALEGRLCARLVLPSASGRR